MENFRNQAILIVCSAVAAATGALLTKKHHIQTLYHELGISKETRAKYFKEQEFINKILLAVANCQPNLVSEIDGFIHKNYNHDQMPSFQLLMLKLEVMRNCKDFKKENGMIAAKILTLMKEHVQLRKKQLSTPTELFLLPNAFEYSVEEQEFAIQLYTLTSTEDDMAENNPDIMKLVSSAYESSPHLLLVKEKMAELPNGPKAILAELQARYQKAPKWYRTKLAICYYRMAVQEQNEREKLELLNESLELAPLAVAYLARFLLYNEKLKMLPNAEQYASYAQDDEMSIKLHGDPKDVLIQLSTIDAMIHKHHDLFLQHEVDVNEPVLAGLYRYYVIKQAEVTQFISMLDHTRSYYQQRASRCPSARNMENAKSFELHYPMFMVDALLHILDFRKCIEQFGRAGQQFAQFPETQSLQKMMRSLHSTFAKYPLLTNLFNKSRLVRFNTHPRITDYMQDLAKMKVPHNDNDELVGVLTAVSLILNAWIVIPNVTFVTQLILPKFVDVRIRETLSKVKFTTGEDLLVLALYPDDLYRNPTQQQLDKLRSIARSI